MTDSPAPIGNVIAASARLGLGYAERMLSGVDADQFARLAKIGDTVIDSNHPCFILGHLSLYAPRVVTELGGDASAIAPSERFVKCFNKDAKCIDDVDGSLYPSMDEVANAFRDGHQVAIETLLKTDDSVFHAENPNEAMRAKFPTVGAMHAFYLGGHLMLHIGQFSAWRRMVGLGAA
ncbi:DinB family protein [Stieleria sp. TO1_6]|uniref:DinB family protein n=1 Tax=Stieleria tagensis TaxID=2956795 RepID=UPI00209A9BA2|nr:DinB family protein [Stieleria tagensis]MCO8121875.1 DinB family protein [Stieleria tagensis]